MIINGKNYKIIEDVKNAFDEEAIKEKLTDFFEKYDYIIGDWAYGSLRLKGFCKPNNKIFNKINDYKLKDTYLKEYCVTECKYFVLEKEKE